MALALSGCGGDSAVDTGSDGPNTTGLEQPVMHAAGNVANGRQVFRFETFGNERFWTDALRLQQGIVATGVKGAIVLLVQKVGYKNSVRDNHLKIRRFSYRHLSGAEHYASGTLVGGRAVAARA